MFGRRLLVLAPHMDDEALAAGGTLASLAATSRIDVAYATDGARSPLPAAPWIGSPAPELPEARRREAVEAMAVLGIPRHRLHFLDLPDGRLRRSARDLRLGVARLLEAVRPEDLLAPFRYDGHPDHVALYRAAVDCLGSEGSAGASPTVYEYFVYHRSRLLPRGDVRAYVRDDLLVAVDVEDRAEVKRRCLERYRTQTTRYFPWQRRPNLTPELLDEACAGPELFVRRDPSLPGRDVLAAGRWSVPLTRGVELPLKRIKDRVLAIGRRR